MNRRQIRVVQGHESIVPLVLSDSVGVAASDPVSRCSVVFRPPNTNAIIFDSSTSPSAFNLQASIDIDGKAYTGVQVDFANSGVPVGRYVAEVYMYDGNEPSGVLGALWGYLDIDVVPAPPSVVV